MKIETLLEMPYEIEGSMPRNNSEVEEVGKLTTVSDFTLGRTYTKIGSFLPADPNLGVVSFHLSKNGISLVGFVKVLVRINNLDREVRNKAIFNLNFKPSNTLECEIPEFNGKRILQVNRVRTFDDFQGLGLATAAYIKLAKAGNVILSDSTQFTDGKMLWKKIINELDFHQYKIDVIDVERGIIGQYDSTNDDKIWTNGFDFSGERVLLALYV